MYPQQCVLVYQGLLPLNLWDSRVRVIVTLGDDHVTFVVTFDNTMRMLHINSRALEFPCSAENAFQFIKSAGNSQVFSRRHRASDQCDSSGVAFTVFHMERLSSLQTFDSRLVGSH